MKTDLLRPFVVCRLLPSGGRVYVSKLTMSGAVGAEVRDMTDARRFSHRHALAVCARNGALWIIANVNPPAR